MFLLASPALVSAANTYPPHVSLGFSILLLCLLCFFTVLLTIAALSSQSRLRQLQSMTKGKGRNPGASSLNKHVKRKEHQERSQPAHRKHLGELEKHRDHALRAKKRRVKQQKLLQMKRGAAQRNPDEFNIGMTKAIMDIASGRMKKRKVILGAKEKATEMKKTMYENQRNFQYLKYKSEADRQRAKDILDEDAAVAYTSKAAQGKHVIFAETEEEVKNFDPLKHFDATHEMLRQHPAVRGTITVLQNTVLPEEVLLSGGHTVMSTSQRRKERQKLQDILKKSDAVDPSDRAEIVKRVKAKRELKQYRFSDVVNEMSSSPGENAEDPEGEDSTEGGDEVSKLLAYRKQKEEEESLITARRMKEFAQRMERSKSLSALAKSVTRQNAAIKSQLTQKKNSRFKLGAPRRSR